MEIKWKDEGTEKMLKFKEKNGNKIDDRFYVMIV